MRQACSTFWCLIHELTKFYWHLDRRRWPYFSLREPTVKRPSSALEVSRTVRLTRYVYGYGLRHYISAETAANWIAFNGQCNTRSALHSASLPASKWSVLTNEHCACALRPNGATCCSNLDTHGENSWKVYKKILCKTDLNARIRWRTFVSRLTVFLPGLINHEDKQKSAYRKSNQMFTCMNICPPSGLHSYFFISLISSRAYFGNMRYSSMSVFCFSPSNSAVRRMTSVSRFSACLSSFFRMVSTMSSFLYKCHKIRVHSSR